MRFCKKCHKRVIEVLTTMTVLRNGCICNDDGLTRIGEDTEAMERIGTLTSPRSRSYRRGLSRNLWR